MDTELGKWAHQRVLLPLRCATSGATIAKLCWSEVSEPRGRRQGVVVCVNAMDAELGKWALQRVLLASPAQLLGCYIFMRLQSDTRIYLCREQALLRTQPGGEWRSEWIPSWGNRRTRGYCSRYALLVRTQRTCMYMRATPHSKVLPVGDGDGRTSECAISGDCTVET